MTPYARAIVALLGLSVACAASLPSQRTDEAQSPFPLSTGTYWVYRGVVRWTSLGSSEVAKRTVTWKMEVTEALDGKRIKAAVIKGHPADLNWYEDGIVRGDYLIVGVDGKKFFLLGQEPRRSAILSGLKGDRDLPADLLGQDEVFLDFPLTPGKAFGEPEQLTRQDGFYAWRVESREEVSLRHVKGLSNSPRLVRYRLSFRTLPDHVIMDFVPGVGITRYIYGHHGTVSETDLRLIEYHPGSGQQRSTLLGK